MPSTPQLPSSPLPPASVLIHPASPPSDLMNVHLVDGTYELFRHYFALPSSTNDRGQEVAAARGVCGSILSMLEDGATHVAVATDHVIESFRNELWPGYKDGSGIEPELFSQFAIVEESLEAMGVAVWRMVEYEADDGLASGVALASRDQRVDHVFICTPDKDLAQCVAGTRVLQFHRRERQVIDEEGIKTKFGVSPASIPDYLALVGDSADGYPGLPGWGKKSAATVLARYDHLEHVPADGEAWDVELRGKAKLARTLVGGLDLAFLFREIATLVRDAPVSASIDELRWRGPRRTFRAVAKKLGAPKLVQRAEDLAKVGASRRS